MWSLFEGNELERLHHERKAAAEETFIQRIRDRQAGRQAEPAMDETAANNALAELLGGEDHGQQQGGEASPDLWRDALDEELKQMRTQTNRVLFKDHWDAIGRMAGDLEQKMLTTTSELAHALLMESFWAWEEQERLILASRSAAYWDY